MILSTRIYYGSPFKTGTLKAAQLISFYLKPMTQKLIYGRLLSFSNWEGDFFVYREMDMSNIGNFNTARCYCLHVYNIFKCHKSKLWLLKQSKYWKALIQLRSKGKLLCIRLVKNETYWKVGICLIYINWKYPRPEGSKWHWSCTHQYISLFNLFVIKKIWSTLRSF